MNIIELDTTPISSRLIGEYICENEYLLPDPLSLHVDVMGYAMKLNQYGRTFVCIDEGNIIGLVSGYINDIVKKEAYLQIIIVSERGQGKRIGSQLIDTFISKSRTAFTHGKVFLTVDNSNQKANSIYQHKGFRKSERIHANPFKTIMEYCF